MSRRMGVLPGALVAACIAATLASCGSEPTTTEGPRTPAALSIVGGNAQEGLVGQELAQALVVRVEDEDGKPIAGQLVNFRVVAGGGSMFAGSGLSNAQGLVQDRWTLGTSTSQEQRVEARAVDPQTGAPIVFATFTAVPKPGAIATLERADGEGQTGDLGAALASPLAVVAKDQYGNPTPGLTVTWQVSGGGGSVGAASSATNEQGRASTTWTLGPRWDEAQRVTASVGAVSTSFSAAPSLPADVVIEVTGNAQTGSVGAALSQPIVVHVRLANGTAVTGAPVMFGTTHGSITPASAITDAEGRASAAWTLGTATGAQQATATINAGRTVALTATAHAGAPAAVTVVSGSGQRARVGTVLPHPFVILVKDQYGNVVPNAAVTWTVVAGGGTIVDAAAATDVSGHAAAHYSLGPTAGTHTVHATAGTAPAAVFTAIADPLPSAMLQKMEGDQQTGVVGHRLATDLVVRVHDVNGTAVPGVTVTARVTSGAGGVTDASGAGTFQTNDQGLVRIAWTLGGASLAQSVHVSIEGDTVAFTATAEPFRLASLADDVPRCGLDGEGRVFCWSGGPSASGPVGGLRLRQLAAGTNHACGVDFDGAVWCWGENVVGQLGNGTASNSSSGPVRALLDRPAERVVTGTYNTCALTAEGDYYCWGLGSNPLAPELRCSAGVVGGVNASRPCVITPTEVPALKGLTSFSLIQLDEIINGNGCGLTTDGRIACINLGNTGQGLTYVESPQRFTRLDLGAGACALTAEGQPYCWAVGLSPTAVSSPVRFVSISVGDGYACALTALSEAYCWGDGPGGQLGDGVSWQGGPVRVTGGLRFREIRAGMRYVFGWTCALTLDGGLACWGYRIGSGAPELQRSPWFIRAPLED